MTAQTRSVLYTYFETGDKPTQSNFQDTIDSFVTQLDTSAQIITSDVSCLGDFTVSGNLTVGGSLESSGTLTINSLTISDDFSVSGNSTLNTVNASRVSANSMSSTTTVSAFDFRGVSLRLTSFAEAAYLSFNTDQGIVGSTNGSNAQSGSVGEVVTASAAEASVSLTINTPQTITSVLLSAGDWDVWGNIIYAGVPGVTITAVLQGISTGDNVFPATNNAYNALGGISAVAAGLNMIVQPIVFTVSAATTCYLIAQSTFTGGTLTAGGNIIARRRR